MTVYINILYHQPTDTSTVSAGNRHYGCCFLMPGWWKVQVYENYLSEVRDWLT